jgi:hypothetical protein
MTTAGFPNTPGTAGAGSSLDEPDTGVKQQAQQTAGTAADEGKHVAGTAGHEARQVASEAKSQARSLLDEATTQVDEQSRAQKDRLAETVRTFSDDLDQMSVQGSGMASEMARQVAERARSLSSQLESKEPRELLDDVRDFARRKPGTFLLGALAAGVVAGRLTRGAKEAQSNGGSSTPTGAAHRAPVVADVTSPADPLTTGANAPSSGFGSTGAAGTATGAPLAGVQADDTPTYPNAPADSGSTFTDPSQPGGRP